MINAVIGRNHFSTMQHKRYSNLLNRKKCCSMMSPLINQTNYTFKNMTVGFGHPANPAIEQLQPRCGGFIFSVELCNQFTKPQAPGSICPTQLKLIHQKMIIRDPFKQLGRVFEKNRIGINENGFARQRNARLDSASLTPVIITACPLPGVQHLNAQRQHAHRPAIKCLRLISHQCDRKVSRIFSVAQRRQNTEFCFKPINFFVAIQQIQELIDTVGGLTYGFHHLFYTVLADKGKRLNSHHPTTEKLFKSSLLH